MSENKYTAVAIIAFVLLALLSVSLPILLVMSAIKYLLS